MPGPVVYLNGELVQYDDAKIGVEDRAVQFGDGVYEVVRYYGGRAFKMDSHMRRLVRSAAGVELPIPPVEELVAAMDELVRRQGMTEATVYLQITRGQTTRFQGIPTGLRPNVIAIARPATSERPATGLAAVTQSDDRWARCHLKTTMLLPAMLARQRARRAGAEDAIFIRDGFVTEATAANVFAALDGQPVTPPLSNYLLPGVTREALLELYGRERIAYREEPVSAERLAAAEEIFLTSTNGELRPIVQLDGRPVGGGKVGPVFERTLALFDAATRQLAPV
ncbi:MAG TPA: aminotransferase class IV [Chloroflexota bacterium]|jgi:D-alanine transaminase|nr:aminotransferase class IV [Chloroflexota bacterium]